MVRFMPPLTPGVAWEVCAGRAGKGDVSWEEDVSWEGGVNWVGGEPFKLGCGHLFICL